MSTSVPKPRLLSLRLTIVVCLLISSERCREIAPPPAAPLRVRIATGLPGMTFRSLGEALAATLEGVLPRMHFEVVATEGSVTNIQKIDAGEAELGLALADVAYMGYNGRVAELSTSTRRVRGIAVLHPSTVHVLVARESPIQSLSDLRNHRVGVGPSGSGTAVTSTILLRAYGVPADKVGSQALSFLDAIDALRQRQLDAVFITAADPVAAVRQAIQSGARLLDIEGPQLEQLRVTYPFLRPATIPANTYVGQTAPVQTVRVDVLLLCRADLDDVVVHAVTDALFQVLPKLIVSDDYLRLVDVRRAPTTPVPLHPGAAWYYRERELSR